MLTYRLDVPKPSVTDRLVALDLFRGLIVALMALDHANYFVAQKHPPSEHWAGPFPTYPSALPFLTRFVTHLAAPGFFLLMGAGMTLFARSRLARGWRPRSIVSHFLIRGALLIALQFLIVNRAWELSPGGWEPTIYLGVIAALGATMILAGALVWLRPGQLALLAVVLLLAAELAVPDPGASPANISPILPITFVSGGDARFWSNYPPLAWLELVVLGLALGHSYAESPRDASRLCLSLGVLLLLLFLPLRAVDGFGNLRPRVGNHWIDFLNVVKYPPSVTFTLLTTGINLVLLGAMSQGSVRRTGLPNPLVVLGRTPLLFYVTHLFLYATLGRWLAPNGTSIPAMIPFWLLGLLLLLPLCAAYGRLKDRQPPSSPLRFF
jgi:uncharacterized membrane protein